MLTAIVKVKLMSVAALLINLFFHVVTTAVNVQSLQSFHVARLVE